MNFAIAIHKDEGSTYGVTVPDIPGCFSWGESVEDAVKNAREAIYGHVETLLELGQTLEVKTSKLEDLLANDQFADALCWMMVPVDLSELDKTPERVNISVPRFALRQIDRFVAEHHDSRSGFLTRAALAELHRLEQTA